MPSAVCLHRAVVDLTDGADRASNRGDIDDLVAANLGLVAFRLPDHLATDRLQGQVNTGQVNVNDLVPSLPLRNLWIIAARTTPVLSNKPCTQSHFLYHLLHDLVSQTLVGSGSA